MKFAPPHLFAMPRLIPKNHDMEYITKNTQMKQLSKRVEHQIKHIQNLSSDIQKEMEKLYLSKRLAASIISENHSKFSVFWRRLFSEFLNEYHRYRDDNNIDTISLTDTLSDHSRYTHARLAISTARLASLAPEIGGDNRPILRHCCVSVHAWML